MTPIYVHTLGDSTLDNLYWMLGETDNLHDAKADSVEGQLKKKLNEGLLTYQVVSHAYDGFTTSSILNGGNVGSVLNIHPSSLATKNKNAYLREKNIDPASASYFVHPLNDLKKSITEPPKATHYVVISVGGNDFRERLSNPLEMLREIPRIQERYLRILAEVKGIQDRDIRPILMFQYHLDANRDVYGIYKMMRAVGMIFATIHSLSILGMAASAVAMIANKVSKRAGFIFILIGATFLILSHKVIPLKVTRGILSGQEVGMATLGYLMESFYQPIVKQAKTDRIPILDLASIFNPYDTYLYLSQIEPSKMGGWLIAEGINEIVKRHPFNPPAFSIYSKTAKGHYWERQNWCVDYPAK